MEPLVNGNPGLHECWEELAEHALTHDDLERGEVPLRIVHSHDVGEPCNANCKTLRRVIERAEVATS